MTYDFDGGAGYTTKHGLCKAGLWQGYPGAIIYGVFETIRETNIKRDFHSSTLKLDEDYAKKNNSWVALGKTGL